MCAIRSAISARLRAGDARRISFGSGTANGARGLILARIEGEHSVGGWPVRVMVSGKGERQWDGPILLEYAGLCQPLKAQKSPATLLQGFFVCAWRLTADLPADGHGLDIQHIDDAVVVEVVGWRVRAEGVGYPLHVDDIHAAVAVHIVGARRLA